MLSGNYIFETRQIWFSQNRLQKVLIFTFSIFFEKNYTLGLGINIFIKEILPNSHWFQFSSTSYYYYFYYKNN